MLSNLKTYVSIFALCCFCCAVSAAPSPRVYRDRVSPQWSADGQRFCYRLATGPNRQEFVLVDATRGVRQPAFDHARLAVSLQGAGLAKASAENLPLEALSWDAAQATLRFKAGGRMWICDLATYALVSETASEEAAAQNAWRPGEGPKSSRRTGDETSVTFKNQTGSEIEILWLSTDGTRTTYGRLRPGEQREQHTFSGHVWVVLTVGNDAIDLGVFQAGDEPQTWEIKGPVSTRPKPDKEPGTPTGRRGYNLEPGTNSRPWKAIIQDYNACLRSEDGAREKQLTRDGTATNRYELPARWSPDGLKVVIRRKQAGGDRKVFVVEASPKDQVQPRLLSYDYLKPGDPVEVAVPHLFDIATGCELPIPDLLFTNAYSISDIRWQPGSSEFTFVYNQRGHQVMRLIAVNATNGQPRAVIEETSPTFIHYSGNFFCEYLDDSAEVIWASERDGWNHLYLYDFKTGVVKSRITRGNWVMRGVDKVDRDRRQIWFRASGILPGQDPYHVHFCRVNFDGSDLVVLTEGDGTHSAQWSPDRSYFVDTYSRVDLPPRHELRSGKDGRLICQLEESDTSACVAADPDWKTPERFTAKGRDGTTDVYGIIHWPKSFDARRKYPVIESIYAGPQDSHVPKAFTTSHSQRRLADQGFVVVQIDGMGTANRGKKFHDVCWKNLVDAGLPDRVLWINAAAKKHPSLDTARVGIYGTSAGGQNALGALLTHGDFYQAGVADCGCHDNRMDKIWWNEQWMGWPVGPHYAEQSNVTLADRLRGKLLLLVGEVDRNVDPASTMQVVSALIRADKKFELLVMPGVGHGTLVTPYAQKRMIDFFRESLGGPK